MTRRCKITTKPSSSAQRNRNIIRCALSFIRIKTTSRPPWPTWTKLSSSIPIIRTRSSEKDFWTQNCTEHRRQSRCHLAPFLIRTCIRQLQQLQHRPPSRDHQGAAVSELPLNCPLTAGADFSRLFSKNV